MKEMRIQAKPDAETIALIKATADSNPDTRRNAQFEFAKALELPLREAVLSGDVLGGIYEIANWEPGTSPEYPLDLIAPGEEDEFVAFTSPGVGYIPERRVSGNYVSITTYAINNAIDWELKFSRQGNIDILSRALRVMGAGFVKKINNDGFHTLIAAAADRNILVYDADATAGTFSKRLISLMKTVMVRNGGGNSTSLRKGGLTDVLTSPEAVEDVRNWNISEVDEITRREIYMASDNSDVLTRVFGVNLHPLHELGVGAEYQKYYTDILGGTMAASDEEIVIGVDLMNRDSFIMPNTLPIEVFPDDNMHRRQEVGYYGWGEYGFGVLDGRRCVLGSF